MSVLALSPSDVTWADLSTAEFPVPVSELVRRVRAALGAVPWAWPCPGPLAASSAGLSPH